MRKLFSTIIITSLFATSFNSAKPFVGEKVVVGSAITAFVCSAALLTTIIYLKNAKKDQSDIKQDFISEKDGIDEIDKQELEKIYGKDKKSGGLVAKILGLGVLPSAAIGGGVYWWLSGYTREGFLTYNEKRINRIKDELGDLIIDGCSQVQNEKINKWVRRFGISSNCYLLEAEKQLKEQYEILYNIKKVMGRQNINELNQEFETLTAIIDQALELILNDEKYNDQIRRHDKLRREEKLQDNIRSERNHEHARDAMWIWAFLNGIGKVASIFGG